MKAVIQRVNSAILQVEGKTISEIKKGFLIFLGVGTSDDKTAVIKLGNKISKLRIFNDEDGKMNLSLGDVGGEILLVSQFTLFADCSHGNRPNFLQAERPERANMLYEMMKEYLIGQGLVVKTGVFGADMKIEASNDGPVTIIIDTNELS